MSATKPRLQPQTRALALTRPGAEGAEAHPMGTRASGGPAMGERCIVGEKGGRLKRHPRRPPAFGTDVIRPGRHMGTGRTRRNSQTAGVDDDSMAPRR